MANKIDRCHKEQQIVLTQGIPSLHPRNVQANYKMEKPKIQNYMSFLCSSILFATNTKTLKMLKYSNLDV